MEKKGENFSPKKKDNFVPYIKERNKLGYIIKKNQSSKNNSVNNGNKSQSEHMFQQYSFGNQEKMKKKIQEKRFLKKLRDQSETFKVLSVNKNHWKNEALKSPKD